MKKCCTWFDPLSSLNSPCFNTLVPLYPCILFRKGLEVTPITSASPAATPSPSVSPLQPSAGAVLEWWELPQRLRRPPIDDLEIEAINMGGTEKPFC